MLSYEVEHGADALVRLAPQPATELLQEDRRTISWAQKEQGIHGRDIDAFVEQVDREHCPQFAARELLQCGASLFLRGFRGYSHRWQVGRIELVSHESSMGHRYAEAECPHCLRIGDSLERVGDDAPGQYMVTGDQIAQLLRVITAAAAPRDRSVVGSVGDSVVGKRNQAMLIDGVPQA